MSLSAAPNPAPLTACIPGATNCTNDTTNDAALVALTLDTAIGARIHNLWNAQCANIYAEASSSIGHVFRVAKCQAIARGAVPDSALVSLVLSSTVQTQALSCQPPVGGCIVDADVNTAIGAILTINEASASTTATAASGANAVTVASPTGIVRGQNVYAAGVPPGTTVVFVSGTTIYLSAVTSAALSATPIAFVLDTGWPTSP